MGLLFVGGSSGQGESICAQSYFCANTLQVEPSAGAISNHGFLDTHETAR
jgi:hypothetical protein